MASFVFNKASSLIDEGITVRLGVSTIKIMLVTDTYIPTPDDAAVDLGGGTGLVAAEINVSGYVRGWGGAGRKTLASKTFTFNNSTDRATFDNAVDLTWTTLAAGTTIHASVIIMEQASNDTNTIPIAYLEALTPTPTNGGDFTGIFNTLGIFYTQQ